MSLNDLQGWLVAEGLREDLDQLTRHTVVAELDNLVPPAEDKAPDVARRPCDGACIFNQPVHADRRINVHNRAHPGLQDWW